MTSPGSTSALVVAPGGDLEVEQRAIPRPAPHEALVRIAFGGICGSDLGYWRHGAAGESRLRGPMVLGHEVSGYVEEEAADGSGPTRGTLVAVHPATSPALAPDGTTLRAGSYLGSAAHWPHTDGALAGTVAMPTHMLRVVPSHVPPQDAALAEPAAVAWHAVGQAGPLAGRRVLVVGCGPIGLLVIAVLKRAGAPTITAIDIHAEPLRRAAAIGADAALMAKDLAPHAGAFDAVFESSGTPAGLRTAIQSARRGGRVVMLGLLPPGDQPVAISTAIAAELELVGSFRFQDEISEVIDAFADGSLNVDGIVTHEFDLDDAAEAFRVASDPRASGKVLLRLTDTA